MILDAEINNEALLDRICEVYGFHQKIQLARHFDIAASSLQNRYTRGTVSYDFAVKCSMDTGANIRWLLTGDGPRFSGETPKYEVLELKSFTLSESKLIEDGILSIDPKLFGKVLTHPQCVKSDGKTHVIELSASISDGLWLVDIEGSISIRELALLPARRLHVTGGRVPFECGIDEIKTLGRVVGIYTEVN
ncbi:TPA: phage repressor protein CI [Yersinia enterocolitica]|uniref:phage repressor protein CI n=1 Tax=Yersinia TaxID=629 RepID=UPI0005AD5B0D|nr:phage repressor protein CI [Yersinia pseudotuberculosis]EKN3487485.1 phage repressor protein CI [Yersinia enterocolitica]AJK17011.1 repressor protein CI [Yersinia pseudotuberculosis str. PA3606]EKN3848304.1 phage repressor protein CI [Yersinia enterocolitica]CNF86078.1 CI repressor [Yersinia pseudotuberculosis]HDL7056863.1 phage repressor protein CI [Yersinia enterocolitica]